MKYLVSGATGFVGRELCGQLASRKIPFTGLSQRGGQLPDGTPTVAVDFNSREVEPGLLRGVDAVFHLAGIAHQQARDSAYKQVNHLATLALAKAAAAAGVKCFIYLSSVKAMGAPHDGAQRTEEQLSLPTSAYGLSKLQAEQDLQALFSDSKMSVIILRPALVYGPGVKGNLLSLRRAVRAGVPRPPELGGRSMIALQDLVELTLQIASRPPAGCHKWIVCDGHSYSVQRIYDSMRRAAGKRRGVAWLPDWGWKFATFLADGLRNRGADSTFQKLFGTELYSSAAIMRELSWQPQFELEDIVSEIMAAPDEKTQ